MTKQTQNYLLIGAAVVVAIYLYNKSSFNPANPVVSPSMPANGLPTAAQTQIAASAINDRVAVVDPGIINVTAKPLSLNAPDVVLTQDAPGLSSRFDPSLFVI